MDDRRRQNRRGQCLGADDTMIKKSRKLVPHICGIGWCLLAIVDQGPATLAASRAGTTLTSEL